MLSWPDEMALPSDTEAALECVFSQAPNGARLNGYPCLPLHALYAVVHQATDVDCEIRRLRTNHIIRVLQLPNSGSDLVVMREADYLAAHRDLNGPFDSGWLSRTVDLHISKDELAQMLQVDYGHLDEACTSLIRAGWLNRKPASLQSPTSGEVLLLAMPQTGRLMASLMKCCDAVLLALRKNRFGCVPRRVVERASMVRKVLASTGLDLRYVMRDMIGRRLLTEQQRGSGADSTTLTLTQAGQQAANTAALQSGVGQKRKR